MNDEKLDARHYIVVNIYMNIQKAMDLHTFYDSPFFPGI